jgi:hypothetical protein
MENPRAHAWLLYSQMEKTFHPRTLVSTTVRVSHYEAIDRQNRQGFLNQEIQKKTTPRLLEENWNCSAMFASFVTV